MKTIFPTRISHYPSGNKNKKAISQRQDLAIEYIDKDVAMRKLGTMSYLRHEEVMAIGRTIPDAIERYREGIRGIFTDSPFSVILEADEFNK